MAVNVLLAASLTQLIGMVASLHMMSYLKMLNLQFPGNANMFMLMIINLINLDILDPSWTTEKLFTFNMEIDSDFHQI